MKTEENGKGYYGEKEIDESGAKSGRRARRRRNGRGDAEKAKAEASAPLQEDADNAKEKENSPSEQQGDAGISQSDAVYGPSSVPMPQQIHCRKCGTVMENGVCPKCGYKLYVPMDGKKLNRIRWIVGGICVAAFVVWLIIKSVKG